MTSADGTISAELHKPQCGNINRADGIARIGFGALVKTAFRSGSVMSRPPLSRVRANLAVTVRQLGAGSNKVAKFSDDRE
jgi:hypothetical protein